MLRTKNDIGMGLFVQCLYALSLHLVAVVFDTAIPTFLYIFGKCFIYLYYLLGCAHELETPIHIHSILKLYCMYVCMCVHAFIYDFFRGRYYVIHRRLETNGLKGRFGGGLESV